MIRGFEEFFIADIKSFYQYPFDQLVFLLKLELPKFKCRDQTYQFDIYRHDRELSIPEGPSGIPDLVMDYENIRLLVEPHATEPRAGANFYPRATFQVAFHRNYWPTLLQIMLPTTILGVFLCGCSQTAELADRIENLGITMLTYIFVYI